MLLTMAPSSSGSAAAVVVALQQCHHHGLSASTPGASLKRSCTTKKHQTGSNSNCHVQWSHPPHHTIIHQYTSHVALITTNFRLLVRQICFFSFRSPCVATTSAI